LDIIVELYKPFTTLVQMKNPDTTVKKPCQTDPLGAVY